MVNIFPKKKSFRNFNDTIMNIKRQSRKKETSLAMSKSWKKLIRENEEKTAFLPPNKMIYKKLTR